MESESPGVLIIGGGRGGTAMLKVLIGEHLLPVSGVVDAQPSAPAFRVARSHGIRTYRTLKDALAECDPCLAFNVTGDVAIDAELRRRHHKGGAVGGTEAFLIWGMVTRMQEMRRSLKRLADRDPLTGLFNRRVMMDRLRQDIAEISRYQLNYSAALLDIDDFKKINDTFGHLAGDAVIKAIVSTVKSELRDADVLGRLGGDEFLVLMPHCDRAQATAAARRWLDRRKERKIVLGAGRAIHITFSVGVSAFDNAWAKKGKRETLNFFLETLDRNLYQAKRAGRARVVNGVDLSGV